MFNDENVNLYAYTLMISGLAIGAALFASPPTLDIAPTIAGLPDSAAIETASIAEIRTPPGARAWNYPAIAWMSYADGRMAMAATGKPGIVVIHRDACLECRNFQEQFHSRAVSAFADDYVFMLVDADREPVLNARYASDGDYAPRIVAVNADGSVRVTKSGSHPEHAFFVDPYSPTELASLLARAR